MGDEEPKDLFVCHYSDSHLSRLSLGCVVFFRSLVNFFDAFVDLLLRCAAIDCEVVDTGADLLFKTTDPLHEELVEIRSGDGEEFDPLK